MQALSAETIATLKAIRECLADASQRPTVPANLIDPALDKLHEIISSGGRCLSPRGVRVFTELADDWRRMDEVA
jgi:hypothetical protein